MVLCFGFLFFFPKSLLTRSFNCGYFFICLSVVGELSVSFTVVVPVVGRYGMGWIGCEWTKQQYKQSTFHLFTG